MSSPYAVPFVDDVIRTDLLPSQLHLLVQLSTTNTPDKHGACQRPLGHSGGGPPLDTYKQSTQARRPLVPRSNGPDLEPVLILTPEAPWEPNPPSGVVLQAPNLQLHLSHAQKVQERRRTEPPAHRSYHLALEGGGSILGSRCPWIHLHQQTLPNWMTPFINYLEKGELPEDKGKAQRLKAKSSKFFMEEGILYRRTFSSPTLKCIGPGEAQYCLMEVHEGICGDHMSAKALAHKIIRQGYYWPTIHQDSIDFVKKCKECQLFSNVTRMSPVLPSSVLSPIPFAIWGIDIMGPFPRAKGDLRYLLVSIDYMTKWVEAKAMRTINQQDCIKFMDNILMRFGIPRVLVSDNGPQFIGSEFESYLQERGIQHKKSSVAYPQGNGQVEVTNRILLRGIEKRLRESKTKWPEELPNVLWAYRTSPRTSTGETPFKLAYGTEAMLPIEVGSPSHRAINFDEIANEEGLRTNIELIDEVRDQVVAKMEKYKQKTREHFSKTSRVKNFQVGDLVLRDTEASDSTNTGKLMPKWEGPYKVKEVLRPGTYKLMNMDGSEVPNTWHGLRLRKFYQ
ncbi:hypothetical protein AgCh_000811 [Apium graveolens]